MAGTSSQRCGSYARSAIAAPASATPLRPIGWPSTTHCSLPSFPRCRCGMRSPHFAFDIRLVQTSGCSCTWSSVLMNPYLSFMSQPPSRETVQTQRVAVAQLIALVLRHPVQNAIDELARLGIGRGRMREIRFPHDVVHPDVMAELDTRALVPEVYVELALEDL